MLKALHNLHPPAAPPDMTSVTLMSAGRFIGLSATPTPLMIVGDETHLARNPDAGLFILCTEFRRADATLAAIPGTDEPALDAAWAARQRVLDLLAVLRPVTEAGRREKAAVGVTVMSEVAAWQRDSEVLFAMAVFQAEAGA